MFKEQMVQHLIQAESQFLGDLEAFHTHFAATMPHFQVQKNKLAFQPEDCDILVHPTQSLISAHETLLDELRQRYSADHLYLIADLLLSLAIDSLFMGPHKSQVISFYDS